MTSSTCSSCEIVLRNYLANNLDWRKMSRFQSFVVYFVCICYYLFSPYISKSIICIAERGRKTRQQHSLWQKVLCFWEMLIEVCQVALLSWQCQCHLKSSASWLIYSHSLTHSMMFSLLTINEEVKQLAQVKIHHHVCSKLQIGRQHV